MVNLNKDKTPEQCCNFSYVNEKRKLNILHTANARLNNSLYVNKKNPDILLLSADNNKADISHKDTNWRVSQSNCAEVKNPYHLGKTQIVLSSVIK